MPSQRRIKAFGLLVLLCVLTTIYFTSAARQTRESEFYLKTAAAMQQKEETKAAEARAAQAEADARLNVPDADVGKRLREAEAKAKKAADEKGRLMTQQVMGEGVSAGDGGGKSVAGRIQIKDENKDEKETLGVAKVGGAVGEKDRSGEADGETEEEHELEVELNAILKKSPIIVFSKTFCPYSKKAKHILLDIYNITPAPYVVELDVHPLGAQLQAALARMTKRRTVPNVLINGVSIGGGDDVEELHVSGKLENTIRSMSGKRVTEIKLMEGAEDEQVEMRRERSREIRRRGRV